MRPAEQQRSLGHRFASFATEARNGSPLYAQLAEAIADDPAIAAVLEAAPASQRRPNLLFAAVHDLLLAGVEHELRRYYPSVGGHTPPDARTVPAFRAFVEEQWTAIRERVATRSTQTNEVGRCAALRPALAHLASRTGRPLALVEIGASAGLLLHVDRYRTRYRDGDRRCDVGPATSAATIETAVRGRVPPHLELPEIVARTGIDLDPRSPADEDDARWLRACVWPDQPDRLARLDGALRTAARHDDVSVIRGDVSTIGLGGLLDDAPIEATVCVLHSAALAYLDDAEREHIEQELDRLGAGRDLARIGVEGAFLEPFSSQERRVAPPRSGEERFLVGLSHWSQGRRTDHLLARAHPHGAWLEWLAA